MNEPKLRFNEFKDEWFKKEFINLLNNEQGIRRGPFGSSIKKSDFIPNGPYVVYEQQNAIYNRFNTRYNISMDKYNELNNFHINKGDFIMSGAGTIGKISIVPENAKNGVFNQALIRLRINRFTDSNYFLQYMKSNLMQKKLKENNPGSAMQNLRPMKEIKQIIVNFPSLNEQQKIGSFFEKLDQLVQLQSDRLEHLELNKKAYLQKIFPNNKVPSLKIKNISNEWKTIKLGDLVSWKRGSGLSKEKLNINKIGNPVIHYADLYKFDNVQKHVIHWSKSNEGTLIPKNSLLFPMSDVTPNGLATTSSINNDTINAGSDILIATINKKCISDFLSFEINHHKQKILKLVVGTTIRHISAKSLDTIKVSLPSLNEQRIITNLFSNLDQQINLQQQKLDNLQQQKKAYLQKMFI